MSIPDLALEKFKAASNIDRPESYEHRIATTMRAMAMSESEETRQALHVLTAECGKIADTHKGRDTTPAEMVAELASVLSTHPTLSTNAHCQQLLEHVRSANTHLRYCNDKDGTLHVLRHEQNNMSTPKHTKLAVALLFGGVVSGGILGQRAMQAVTGSERRQAIRAEAEAGEALVKHFNHKIKLGKSNINFDGLDSLEKALTAEMDGKPLIESEETRAKLAHYVDAVKEYRSLDPYTFTNAVLLIGSIGALALGMGQAHKAIKSNERDDEANGPIRENNAKVREKISHYITDAFLEAVGKSQETLAGSDRRYGQAR